MTLSSSNPGLPRFSSPRCMCAKKIAIILCGLVMLCGCDTNKAERNSLMLTQASKGTDLTSVELKIRDIEAGQVNLNTEIVTLKDALTKDEAAIKENKKSLADYVLDHKAAVTAVAATGAGIAGILADNLNDQQRAASIWVAAIGAGYCMFSEDDCSDATVKVTYYGGQIVYYKNDATTQSDKISALRQRLAELEETKAPFLAERMALNTDIDTLKSQIEALVCHGMFCL